MFDFANYNFLHWVLFLFCVLIVVLFIKALIYINTTEEGREMLRKEKNRQDMKRWAAKGRMKNKYSFTDRQYQKYLKTGNRNYLCDKDFKED